MRLCSPIIVLLCLLVVKAVSRLSAQPQVHEKMTVWLNPQANQKSRVDAFLAIATSGETWGELTKRYASNSEAVSDALILAFEQSEKAGGQPHALYYMMVVGDRASYSQVVERALSSSVNEVRGNAFSAAAVFGDRSGLMVSALVSEIRNTNAPPNFSLACRASAKLQLEEAIEPLTDVVAHSGLGRASTAVNALAEYPSLPAQALTRLDAARTRFEREQSEANKRPKTAFQLSMTNPGLSEFEFLFKALDKVKEKALLPPPPGMEAPKARNPGKKTEKAPVVGKAAPTGRPVTEKDSAIPAAKSGGAGRSSLLVFLGLASIAVIAWFLLKGRLR